MEVAVGGGMGVRMLAVAMEVGRGLRGIGGGGVVLPPAVTGGLLGRDYPGLGESGAMERRTGISYFKDSVFVWLSYYIGPSGIRLQRCERIGYPFCSIQVSIRVGGGVCRILFTLSFVFFRLALSGVFLSLHISLL